MTIIPNHSTSCPPRPLAVSLFAGVGGLDLGLAAAGFEIAIAIEREEQTAAQYQENFPDTLVWCADVSQLSGAEIRSAIVAKYPNWDGQLGLVCGGPPCQGFSRMGRRDPNDERNQLIRHFARLVGELQPIAFVMENVSGLLAERYKELVSNVRTTLEEFEYNTQEWLLSAADFCVPQERLRVFWVGSRQRAISQPTPSGEQVTVRDAISDLLGLEPRLGLDKNAVETLTGSTSRYVQRLNSLFGWHQMAAPTQLTGCSLTNHSRETVARFQATQPGQVEPISRFKRLAFDAVAPTLRAGTDAAHGRHTAARPIHPQFDRLITVREAARLCSFPDWFEFHPTKYLALRQIGNAVPPLIALAVGTQIYQSLNNSTFENATEGKTMSDIAATPSIYSNRFELPELQQQAEDTKTRFFSFCRNTFDGLVAIGSELNQFKNDCLLNLEERASATFNEWLVSDFGASQYIATAAMRIAEWFGQLPTKLQALVRQNVQNWSVSALKELTKASTMVVQELVNKGKQTATSIRNNLGLTPKLRKDGYAEVLVNDRRQQQGQIGRLVDKPDEIGRVVLEMADGMEAIFNAEDLKPVRKPPASKTPSQDTTETTASQKQQLTYTYTQEQLEALIQQRVEAALAEVRLAQQVEMREAALNAAQAEQKAEVEAAYARGKKEAISELGQNSEQELELQNLQVQQLQQRVAELEKALVDATNRWGHAAAAPSSAAPQPQPEPQVLEQLQHLSTRVAEQEIELAQYRAVVASHTNKTDSLESLTRNFAQAVEGFLPGWSHRGYRASDGTLYTGLDAFKVFIQETTSTNSQDNWSVA